MHAARMLEKVWWVSDLKMSEILCTRKGADRLDVYQYLKVQEGLQCLCVR